jgi:hypothetical protein
MAHWHTAEVRAARGTSGIRPADENFGVHARVSLDHDERMILTHLHTRVSRRCSRRQPACERSWRCRVAVEQCHQAVFGAADKANHETDARLQPPQGVGGALTMRDDQQHGLKHVFSKPRWQPSSAGAPPRWLCPMHCAKSVMESGTLQQIMMGEVRGDSSGARGEGQRTLYRCW